MEAKAFVLTAVEIVDDVVLDFLAGIAGDPVKTELLEGINIPGIMKAGKVLKFCCRKFDGGLSGVHIDLHARKVTAVDDGRFGIWGMLDGTGLVGQQHR